MAPAVAGSNPVTHPITFNCESWQLKVGSSQFSFQLSVQFSRYVEQLEARHLADLRFSEVTRALRALSSTYVERRETALAANKALDGAGKRAAFALYYGPLHFLLIDHIMRAIAAPLAPGLVVDLGCGTGVGGAAIASLTDPTSSVLGIDTHPWAVDEARWTYRALDVRGDARRGNAASVALPRETSTVVAAFVVNELTDKERAHLLEKLLGDRQVLIVEPISQRISPWWNAWVDQFTRAGGRADTWKARIDPPPIVKRLAKASGLRPELLTARSLFRPRVS